MSNDRTASPKKGTKFVCSQRFDAVAAYRGSSILIKVGDLVEVLDPSYAGNVMVQAGAVKAIVTPNRFYMCFVRASSPAGKQLLENAAATLRKASLDTMLDKNQMAELVKKRTRMKPKPIDPTGWPRTGDRFRCTKNVRLSAIAMIDYKAGSVVQVEGLELAGGYVRLMNPLTGERSPRVKKYMFDRFFTCIDRIEDVVAKDKDVFTADERMQRFDGCNGNVYELDVKCKPAELNRVMKPGTNDRFNLSVSTSIDSMRVTGGWQANMFTVSVYEHGVGMRLVNVPVDGLLELLKRSGYVVVTEAVANDMKENDRRKTPKEKREEEEFYETTGKWQG